MWLPIELSRASALPCGRPDALPPGTPTGFPERVHVRHAEARAARLPLSGTRAGAVVLEMETALASPPSPPSSGPTVYPQGSRSSPGFRNPRQAPPEALLRRRLLRPGPRAARKDPSLRAGGRLVRERGCAATPPPPGRNRAGAPRAGHQRTPLRAGSLAAKAVSASPVPSLPRSEGIRFPRVQGKTPAAS